MEMMLDMLSSNIFIIFVILVVLFNIMRRRNKRIHTRTARRQNQLKNRIRDRQAELWDNPQEDAPAREQKDSEQRS
jgi:hypothetical protein